MKKPTDPDDRVMKRMFLRNLPRGSTEDDIVEAFGQYGRIDYVHMPHGVTTFANISFVSMEEVDTCMAARPHQMRGSQVIARRAMPKGYPRELENCNKIFLCSQSGKVEEDKGLDDSIDDKDIAAYFRSCGQVVNVKQLRDPNTNEHKGIGFVEFEDWDGADKAVLLAIHYINGREVEVRKARDDEYLKAVETGVVEAENVGKPVGKMKKLRTDPKDRSMRRVFVRNLPREEDAYNVEEELRETFSQFGELEDIFFPPGSSTFANVTFKALEGVDALMAARPHRLQQNNKGFFGKELFVKRSMPPNFPRELEKCTKIFLCSQTGTPNATQGLDDSVTDYDLREHFSGCGNVVNVIQLRDPKTNAHQGVAFVEFDDADGADKAFLFAIHNVKGKELEVRKARDDEYRRAVETGSIDSESVGTKKKLPSDPSDRLMRRLFVRQLPYDEELDEKAMTKAVKGLFSKFGEVEDVYFPPGAFTYCFVTYSSMEGVDVLMATRPHKVLGTEIKVRRSMPPGFPRDLENCNRVFLCSPSGTVTSSQGLDDSIDDKDLEALFSRCGRVTKVEQMRNDSTNEHQGKAFIEFEDSDSADKAALLAIHVVKGREIEARKGEEFRRSWALHGDLSMDYGGPADQVGLENPERKGRKPTDPKDRVMRRLFVRNLPRDADQEEITQAFSQFGEVEDVFIPPAATTYGFVTFKTLAEVDHCMSQKQHHQVRDRQLSVRRQMPKDYPRELENGRKIFLCSPSGRPTATQGLDDSISDKDLEDYFNTCGRVVSVKQLRDRRTQNHKGVGFVEFDDPDGADKAVLLAVHIVKNREIEVRKAEDDDSRRNNRNDGDWNEGGGNWNEGGGNWNQEADHLGPLDHLWGGKAGAARHSSRKWDQYNQDEQGGGGWGGQGYGNDGGYGRGGGGRGRGYGGRGGVNYNNERNSGGFGSYNDRYGNNHGHGGNFRGHGGRGGYITGGYNGGNRGGFGGNAGDFGGVGTSSGGYGGNAGGFGGNNAGYGGNTDGFGFGGGHGGPGMHGGGMGSSRGGGIGNSRGGNGWAAYATKRPAGQEQFGHMGPKRMRPEGPPGDDGWRTGPF